MTTSQTHGTGLVGYAGDETPYPYRPVDGDATGYEIPRALADRLTAAQREHDAVTEAIRAYIETHQVPEIDLDEVDA